MPSHATTEPSAPRIALIGCGSAKSAHRCKAREMYRSGLFRSSLRWALERCDRAFILSARHGLLGLDEVIEPYDEGLPPAGSARVEWGRRVAAQLDAAVPELDAELVVLAGERYADAIEPMDRDWNWEEPLRGMGIGQRLRWLSEQRMLPPRHRLDFSPAAAQARACRTPTLDEAKALAREFPEFVEVRA